MTSKDANETVKSVFKKVKTKNNSKGDDPNDVKPSDGGDLIEPALFFNKRLNLWNS